MDRHPRGPGSATDREGGRVRWARWLLGLYPPAWRARYAAEMLLVLRAHRITGWTLADLALGALDAQLRRDLLPRRLTPMTQRLRSSEIAIGCAVALFTVAWLPLNRLRDPLPDWQGAVRAHPAIGVLLTALNGAGLVALLALLAAGLPLVGSALRRALVARRRAIPGLLLVPLLAVAAVTAYAAVAAPHWAATRAPGSSLLTPLAVALQLGFVALILAAVAASVGAVALAVARGEPSARALRLALVPSGIAALALGLGLVATLALLAFLQVESPGLLALGTLWPVYALDLLLMAGAAGLGAAALRRGLAAARDGDRAAR